MYQQRTIRHVFSEFSRVDAISSSTSRICFCTRSSNTSTIRGEITRIFTTAIRLIFLSFVVLSFVGKKLGMLVRRNENMAAGSSSSSTEYDYIIHTRIHIIKYDVMILIVARGAC